MAGNQEGRRKTDERMKEVADEGGRGREGTVRKKSTYVKEVSEDEENKGD